jgi:O-antigen/teichoic acid export membrane protein
MKKNPRNFIYLAVSDAASHFLGFLATVYIARVLGAAGFGKISYALAFLNYALLFGNLGLTTIGTREIAKDRQNLSVISDITSIRLVLSGIIFILLVLGGLAIPGDRETKMLVIYYGLCVFPFAVYLEFVFQGREEMGFLSLGRIIQYGAYVAALYLFLKNPSRILAVPAAFFVSYLLASAFLLLAFFTRGLTLNIRLINPAFSKLLKAAVPVGLATLFYQVPLNLAPIVLGVFHSAALVGSFSAGYKIIIFLLIIERVFYYLFLPIASRQYRENPEKLSATFTFFLRAILSLTLPIALGGIVLAPGIIRLIYGPGYEGGVIVLQILLLYFAATPVNTIFGYGLVALDREKKFLKVIAMTSILSLVSIILLGIFLKGWGASLGLLISELVSVFLMKHELNRAVKFRVARYFYKTLVPALGTGVVLYFTPSLNIFLRCGLGVVLYVILYYLMGGYSGKEIRELVGMVTEKNQ